jgi:curved DNA-binding protein CbpA
MGEDQKSNSINALNAIRAKIAAGADYFTLFGLNRNANDAEVQAAFVSLARVLHPDLPALRGDLYAEATEIFQTLTRARLTLTDPERRYEYIMKLPAAPLDEMPKGPDPDKARIHMHRARQLVIRRDWPSAEHALRVADALFGEPFDSECRSELGWAIMNNTENDDLSRAGESRRCFEDVLEAPKDAGAVSQAHYYMALWHKMHGEIPKVKGHLDKCWSINPKHVEAQRELRLFERRRSTSSLERRPTSTSLKKGSKLSSASVAPATTASGEVRKVPLQKKVSLLERLFGKGN